MALAIDLNGLKRGWPHVTKQLVLDILPYRQSKRISGADDIRTNLGQVLEVVCKAG